MAFGVESRTPYLDYRLVSYLAGLPIEAKINRGWTKYILRRAVSGLIPEKIRLRVDKLAFDTPQDRWLAGRLKTDVLEAFRTDGLLSEIVDMDCLLSAFRAYLSPARSWLPGHLFFRAFMLQRWSHLFF